MPAQTETVNQKMSTSTHTEHLTAQQALEHARNVETRLKLALASLQWDGNYTIQAGHNEIALQEGYLMEEILVHLDADFPTLTRRKRILKELAQIFWPYFTTVYTPHSKYDIMSATDIQRIRQWKPGSQFTTTEEASSSNGDNTHGSEHNREMTGIEAGTGGANGHHSSSEGTQNGGITHDSESNVMDIAFTSSLVQNGRDMFALSLGINLKFEENHNGRRKPAPGIWGFPWIGVSIGKLEGTTATPYTLGLLQCQITGATRRDQSLSPMLEKPHIRSAGQETIKKRKDRTRTRSASMGSNPGPATQITGSSAHTTSIEQVQDRWAINVHPIQIEAEHNIKMGTMWKYIHNDDFARVSTHHFFEPPSFVLGRRGAFDQMPKLEFEVVTCWSTANNNLLRRLSILQKPVFATVLHRACVSVDLRMYSQAAYGTVPARTIYDEYTLSRENPRTDYSPERLEVMSSDNQLESQCEVMLQRAVCGSVNRLSKREMIGKESVFSSRGEAQGCHCIIG